jgi:hypothetical protein
LQRFSPLQSSDIEPLARLVRGKVSRLGLGTEIVRSARFNVGWRYRIGIGAGNVLGPRATVPIPELARHRRVRVPSSRCP